MIASTDRQDGAGIAVRFWTDETIDLLAELGGSDLVHAAAVAWRAGFGDGHLVGFGDGYESAEQDMAEAWSQVAAQVRAGANNPTRDELSALRVVDYQPCAVKCDRCSRCIASRSYWQRGGRPYEGHDAERARERLRDAA